MKNIKVLFLLLFITFKLQGQVVTKLKTNCSPVSNYNNVYKKIGGPTWDRNSNLGTGCSFIGTESIVSKDGRFYLKGDIYSTRGGKLNIKENGYDKEVYILTSQWYCQIDD
jgi:hypothetical protein